MGGSHVFAPYFWYSEPERRHGCPLEYQAMPSVAHCGWLCTFTIEQQLEIKLAHSCSWAALVKETGSVRKRQAIWPVHHVQNHTCWVTLLQPARRAAVLGQPSSLHHHSSLVPASSGKWEKGFGIRSHSSPRIRLSYNKHLAYSGFGKSSGKYT